MNIPQIRIKGFDEEWKKAIVSEKCKIGTGKSNTQDQVADGKYPFYIRSEKIMKSNKYLYDCEAVITIGDGNIGKVFHYINGKFDLHQRCYKMTNFNDIDGRYFYYFFSTFFYERAIKMSAKATVDSIRMDMIADMPINFPTLSEQHSIASFFRSLDSLINSTSKKLTSLKQIKAACLQAMFPQNGETKPKVRFNGFDGDWEKIKIGEIASFSKGHGYSKNDLCDKGCPIIMYGRMYTKYSFFMDEVDTFVVPKAQSVYSEGNEVIIPASGETAEDIACAAAITSKGTILGGDLNILSFDICKFSTQFVALYITYGQTHFELAKYAQGKTVVHLHNSDIANGTIMLPSFEEQQKIASYFRSLNNQISLQEKRLEKLKQIKSACLDKMFV